MQHDLIIRDSRIHLVQSAKLANRPTLVFLHDSLGCVSLWRDFPNRLGEATNCNVLVYDRHGYGNSGSFVQPDRKNDYLEKEADVLKELMDSIGINQAVLFGHSDGGSISLIAAAKYPLRISAVITEGAHIFVEDITLHGIEAAVDAFRTTDLPEKLRKYHGDKTRAVFDAWTKTWLSPAFRSWNIEYFLPQIICPVLVIQGENDEFGTLRQVNGIINQVSGPARQLVIPNVGHSPHKESARFVIDESVAFLKFFLPERLV